jgi:hypothetical protein
MTNDAEWDPINVSIAQVTTQEHTFEHDLHVISDVFSDTRLLQRLIAFCQHSYNSMQTTHNIFIHA